MSEPTSDGNQKPDPDPQPGPDHGQDENQASGSVFSDPTAPVWADPTAPIPAMPAPPLPPASTQDTPPLPPIPAAPPGGGYAAYGQQPPEAGQPTPPTASPMSNPYAQQPPPQPSPWSTQPSDPYGQPTGQSGQPYPSQPYPAYGQSPYASSAPTNTSAIILTILSALSLWNILAVAPLVLGIVALTKNSTDPQGSRRFTKIGWIVFVAVWVLVILLVIGFGVLLAVTSSSSSDFSNGF